MTEAERTQFFTVISTGNNGRMEQCHPHETLVQARECAKTCREPLGIVEWQRDRDPQWIFHKVEDE